MTQVEHRYRSCFANAGLIPLRAFKRIEACQDDHDDDQSVHPTR